MGLNLGSRFEVRIPLGEGRPTVAVQPLIDQPIPGASAVAVCTVLLADDNHDAADTLAELLRMDGHTVHTAMDGAQAAAMALKLKPDVLVLDIGMPGLNGYEVARRIRAQPWGQLPYLIAATGWGQEHDRQQAHEAGFDLHLTKPFDPLQLMSAIDQHANVANSRSASSSTVDRV